MAFLDENGLRYLWLKITALLAGYVMVEDGKVLSSNDFTDTLLEKLNGIATGANKTTVENVLTSSSSSNALSAAQGKELKRLIDDINTSIEDLGAGDMLKSVYDTNGNGIVDNAEKVGGLTVQTAVPANAKFTDTVYVHPSHAAKASGLYKITVDAEGHVSAAAVVTKDDITALGIPAQDTKVSVDTAISGTSTNPVQNKVIAAEISSILEDLSNNYALKTEITGVYKYKGSVAAVSNLPTTGNATGDVYNVEARGINYAWNGSAWDALGELFEVPVIANATIDSIVAS